MPVLVENDPAWANALAAGLPAGTQVVASIAQLDNWLAKQDEYAVVLGPNTDLNEAVALAEKLRFDYPTTGIVLLRHELGASVFQTAMNAGIPSVVAANDVDGMAAAVDRNRVKWEAIRGPADPTADRNATVITVFSPKGGVGKTTVAVNLAVALGGSGAARVCLVDLDLAFGDVAITLQLIPEHTIAEAVGAEEHLDFNLLETLLTRHENCSILAAPTHPEGKDRVSPALIRRVLRVLRRHFDYIIVDTSPSFDDQVLHAFDETDECIRDPRRADREEHEGGDRDARRARSGPRTSPPAAESRRRRGRTVAGQRRDLAQDAGCDRAPDRTRGRQRDQPRATDRAQPAGTPGEQGTGQARDEPGERCQGRETGQEGRWDTDRYGTEAPGLRSTQEVTGVGHERVF
jgi:hypothetical protein